MEQIQMLFLDYVRDLEKQVERVRELHKMTYGTFCKTCTYYGEPVLYPCPTIQALDGEK